MKTLKKWVLLLWRVLLWLPWIITKILFTLFGGLLALFHYAVGHREYAKRLFINVREIL